jgi:hypothetical protein
VKRGILFCILFLLPIVIAFVGLEMLLRKIPNSYQLKNAYLDEHAGNIEVLILGHSQNLYGLNPDHFSQHAFNAAHVSQLYIHDLSIFRKYIRDLKKLEWLIIPVTYTSFFDEGSENVFINKNYVLYYGLPNKMGWRYSYELSAFSLRQNLTRVFDHFINGKLDYGVTAYGFGTYYSDDTEHEFEESAKVAAARHQSSKDDFLPENCKAFEELMDLALSYHVRVLLATPPVHSAYYTLIDKESLAMTKRLAREYADRELLIDYVDLDQHPDFTDADFYDADHLNQAGAGKFSRLLNRYLN